MSKTPRGSTSSQTPQRNAYREYQIQLAEWMKERNANPIEVWTPFGLWRSAKDGCGATDRSRVRVPWDTTESGSIEPYDGPPPVAIPSKRKYRGG